MSRKFLTPIQLPADPVAPLEAATKQYVDGKAGASSDEVSIGPNDPGGTIELWYDTDAVPPAGVGNAAPPEIFVGPDDPGLSYTMWYDTDALSQLPWVGAWGLVARPALISTDQTISTINTLTDLTGFTNTFTVVAGRMYEARWAVVNQQQSAAATQWMQITAPGGSGNSMVYYQGAIPSGNITSIDGSFQFAGGSSPGGNVPWVPAGTATIKLQFATSAGTVIIGSNGWRNGRFAIYDVGRTI